MATKMAVIDNMHIHVRGFEFTEFNYEVRSDLRGYIIVSRSSLGPLPSCLITQPLTTFLGQQSPGLSFEIYIYRVVKTVDSNHALKLKFLS